MHMMPVNETWFLHDLKQFGFKNLNVGVNNLKTCLGLTELEISNLNNINSPKSSLSFWICSFFVSPIDVIKIIFLRIFVVITAYKPVFSVTHNIFSFLTLIPLYFFFIIGFFTKINLKKIYILISLILVLISISIHYVDGDNRVFTAFLPLVFIISSGGFFIFLETIKKNIYE